MDRVYIGIGHYVTGESSKEIYKQAPVEVMKQNYTRLYDTGGSHRNIKRE